MTDENDKILANGIALHAASSVLKSLTHQDSPINLADEDPAYLGSLLGSIILKTFSIELLFKAVRDQLGLTSIKGSDGHNLKDLFSSIPNKEKQFIEDSYNIKVACYGEYAPALHELLNDNKSAFVTWRYAHEGGAKKFVYEPMDCLAESLKEFMALVNPKT